MKVRFKGYGDPTPKNTTRLVFLTQHKIYEIKYFIEDTYKIVDDIGVMYSLSSKFVNIFFDDLREEKLKRILNESKIESKIYR